ncbi:helix-turn-helix transcriptional regulator [Rhodococcus sp. KBS0724]|jgi:DNA-binding HxlR family transcriptional regulator|uniref:winged helix-turn-helix transcriptional regulator n=1 Tax=Rhodococcus sp. KBS0724 TaxID=1179674 RepID=UPI00110D3880|nr:helix-turn-helix domain-containing protein [Rhodococcus sp. KBS0724]TSD47835.1 helix-turn-helix transcriptional regulator [Rhodococcus sp. KBS0724]
MTDRAQWTDPHCPVARTTDIVGDRWSLLIVRDAFDGTRRFSQFQRNLGIAKNILTDRLRGLVEQGILEARSNEQGTRNEYVLTDRGMDLFTVIVSLRQWGERHAFSDGEPHSTLVDDSTGDPVPMLRLVNAQNIELDTANTHVHKIGQD